MLVIASVNESKANILAHLEPIDAVMGSIINLLTTSEFKLYIYETVQTNFV